MEISTPTRKASSLRWAILRNSLLRRSPMPDDDSQVRHNRISRRTTRGFDLIPWRFEEDAASSAESKRSNRRRDACVCYTLPSRNPPTKLFLTQRVDDRADLNDFELCNTYNIDNTGLVCHWPSEDVLSYFCLSHADMFRSKRVIELGSGYGLAGLVVAAVTEAAEVVISDGNPQVVDYIQCNIDTNASAFGGTMVKPLILHWNQDEISNQCGTFDVIIASDCTFFKEFHEGLAQTVKSLLSKGGQSEALFFSPQRGDSLSKFLEQIKNCGLNYITTENYEAEIWKRHQRFVSGDESWPNYEKDHCYPLLVRIAL